MLTVFIIGVGPVGSLALDGKQRNLRDLRNLINLRLDFDSIPRHFLFTRNGHEVIECNQEAFTSISSIGPNITLVPVRECPVVVEARVSAWSGAIFRMPAYRNTTIHDFRVAASQFWQLHPDDTLILDQTGANWPDSIFILDVIAEFQQSVRDNVESSDYIDPLLEWRIDDKIDSPQPIFRLRLRDFSVEQLIDPSTLASMSPPVLPSHSKDKERDSSSVQKLNSRKVGLAHVKGEEQSTYLSGGAKNYPDERWSESMKENGFSNDVPLPASRYYRPQNASKKRNQPSGALFLDNSLLEELNDMSSQIAETPRPALTDVNIVTPRSRDIDNDYSVNNSSSSNRRKQWTSSNPSAPGRLQVDHHRNSNSDIRRLYGETLMDSHNSHLISVSDEESSQAREIKVRSQSRSKESLTESDPFLEYSLDGNVVDGRNVSSRIKPTKVKPQSESNISKEGHKRVKSGNPSILKFSDIPAASVAVLVTATLHYTSQSLSEAQFRAIVDGEASSLSVSPLFLYSFLKHRNAPSPDSALLDAPDGYSAALLDSLRDAAPAFQTIISAESLLFRTYTQYTTSLSPQCPFLLRRAAFKKFVFDCGLHVLLLDAAEAESEFSTKSMSQIEKYISPTTKVTVGARLDIIFNRALALRTVDVVSVERPFQSSGSALSGGSLSAAAASAELPSLKVGYLEDDAGKEEEDEQEMERQARYQHLPPSKSSSSVISTFSSALNAMNAQQSSSGLTYMQFLRAIATLACAQTPSVLSAEDDANAHGYVIALSPPRTTAAIRGYSVDSSVAACLFIWGLLCGEGPPPVGLHSQAKLVSPSKPFEQRISHFATVIRKHILPASQRWDTAKWRADALRIRGIFSPISVADCDTKSKLLTDGPSTKILDSFISAQYRLSLEAAGSKGESLVGYDEYAAKNFPSMSCVMAPFLPSLSVIFAFLATKRAIVTTSLSQSASRRASIPGNSDSNVRDSGASMVVPLTGPHRKPLRTLETMMYAKRHSIAVHKLQKVSTTSNNRLQLPHQGGSTAPSRSQHTLAVSRNSAFPRENGSSGQGRYAAVSLTRASNAEIMDALRAEEAAYRSTLLYYSVGNSGASGINQAALAAIAGARGALGGEGGESSTTNVDRQSEDKVDPIASPGRSGSLSAEGGLFKSLHPLPEPPQSLAMPYDPAGIARARSSSSSFMARASVMLDELSSDSPGKEPEDVKGLALGLASSQRRLLVQQHGPSTRDGKTAAGRIAVQRLQDYRDLSSQLQSSFVSELSAPRSNDFCADIFTQSNSLNGTRHPSQQSMKRVQLGGRREFLRGTVSSQSLSAQESLAQQSERGVAALQALHKRLGVVSLAEEALEKESKEPQTVSVELTKQSIAWLALLGSLRPERVPGIEDDLEISFPEYIKFLSIIGVFRRTPPVSMRDITACFLASSLDDGLRFITGVGPESLRLPLARAPAEVSASRMRLSFPQFTESLCRLALLFADEATSRTPKPVSSSAKVDPLSLSRLLCTTALKSLLQGASSAFQRQETIDQLTEMSRASGGGGSGVGCVSMHSLLMSLSRFQSAFASVSQHDRVADYKSLLTQVGAKVGAVYGPAGRTASSNGDINDRQRLHDAIAAASTLPLLEPIQHVVTVPAPSTGFVSPAREREQAIYSGASSASGFGRGQPLPPRVEQADVEVLRDLDALMEEQLRLKTLQTRMIEERRREAAKVSQTLKHARSRNSFAHASTSPVQEVNMLANGGGSFPLAPEDVEALKAVELLKRHQLWSQLQLSTAVRDAAVREATLYQSDAGKNSFRTQQQQQLAGRRGVPAAHNSGSRNTSRVGSKVSGVTTAAPSPLSVPDQFYPALTENSPSKASMFREDMGLRGQESLVAANGYDSSEQFDQSSSTSIGQSISQARSHAPLSPSSLSSAAVASPMAVNTGRSFISQAPSHSQIVGVNDSQFLSLSMTHREADHDVSVHSEKDNLSDATPNGSQSCSAVGSRAGSVAGEHGLEIDDDDANVAVLDSDNLSIGLFPDVDIGDISDAATKGSAASRALVSANNSAKERATAETPPAKVAALHSPNSLSATGPEVVDVLMISKPDAPLSPILPPFKAETDSPLVSQALKTGDVTPFEENQINDLEVEFKPPLPIAAADDFSLQETPLSNHDLSSVISPIGNMSVSDSRFHSPDIPITPHRASAKLRAQKFVDDKLPLSLDDEFDQFRMDDDSDVRHAQDLSHEGGKTLSNDRSNDHFEDDDSNIDDDFINDNLPSLGVNSVEEFGNLDISMSINLKNKFDSAHVASSSSISSPLSKVSTTEPIVVSASNSEIVLSKEKKDVLHSPLSPSSIPSPVTSSIIASPTIPPKKPPSRWSFTRSLSSSTVNSPIPPAPLLSSPPLPSPFTSDINSSGTIKFTLSQYLSKEVYSKEISLLLTGYAFLKFGRSGYPHKRTVYLTSDGTKICWHKVSGKPSSSDAGLPTAEITAIINGRRTPVFERNAKLIGKANCCFSIVTPNRSLDLEAEEVEIKDSWITALQFLKGLITK